MYKKRSLSAHLKKMVTKFPIISLTGPRQTGKTTLLRNEFKSYKYFNLERPDLRELIAGDPLGFLKNNGNKIIFDEVQNLPELFSYIQVDSDENQILGKYILSGSQSFLLNEKISQSLAGRVSINILLPFDMKEYSKLQESSVDELILSGFYPRLHDTNIGYSDFYPSYLQTYIERDVRSLRGIENLNTFSRFLSLCAGRVGQILNLTSLANDCGASVNTAKSWLSLLEASYIIYQLRPYYKNINKRIIKSPKLYFYDTGVVCSLLRIKDKEMLRGHYLYGALFENFIISEIIKRKYHSGTHPSVYYWRESNGTEIDCIIEEGVNSLSAIELKGGHSYNSDYVRNLKIFENLDKDVSVKSRVVYNGEVRSNVSGIEVINWREFFRGVVSR
ncbi:MAG TPA: ATP-binding protein [Ignavibacteriaceae bacterium]|nr:ATP-binding protein [Ignavibacteriaceae bacterium]